MHKCQEDCYKRRNMKKVNWSSEISIIRPPFTKINYQMFIVRNCTVQYNTIQCNAIQYNSVRTFWKAVYDYQNHNRQKKNQKKKTLKIKLNLMKRRNLKYLVRFPYSESWHHRFWIRLRVFHRFVARRSCTEAEVLSYRDRDRDSKEKQKEKMERKRE